MVHPRLLLGLVVVLLLVVVATDAAPIYLYLNSSAPPGGDGTMQNPYNSFDMVVNILDGQLPAGKDITVYIAPGNLIFTIIHVPHSN